MIGFGDFGKKRGLGIVSEYDSRLILIDPTSEGFFDIVLGYVTHMKELRMFIEAVKEVQDAGINPFWKPIYDPSLDGEEVVFKAFSAPAIGHSFNFWKQKAEKMPAVKDKKWSVGTEYQYYAFLVWLINSLVASGWDTEKALASVVLDSKELGHYRNSKDAKKDYEETGLREVCGVCDLANTFKLLACTSDPTLFWSASGEIFWGGSSMPLACIDDRHDVERDLGDAVGWLVLS